MTLTFLVLLAWVSGFGLGAGLATLGVLAIMK